MGPDKQTDHTFFNIVACSKFVLISPGLMCGSLYILVLLFVFVLISSGSIQGQIYRQIENANKKHVAENALYQV